MEFKDYYQTLGVEKSASQDEIKKAFRKLARKYHPDVSKEADAAAKMAQLNEANAVLSDPEKRAAYDSVSAQAAAQGARGGGEFRPPPGWDTGFEFSGGPSEGGGGDYSDFFEQLFGQAARQRGGAGSAGGFGQGGGHAARR
ncbi:MAG: DnaJ domain-containing protein, partial [Giesbergeria sp.]